RGDARGRDARRHRYSSPPRDARAAGATRCQTPAVGLGGLAMTPQESLTETSAPTREEEQAEVIRRLEEDIIFGRFAPGSRLVEDTLMTRYGASRHFVRQALFSACGNPYLVHSLQDYMNLTLPMRAKNLADKEGLALSRRQHELMIELLKGRDSWALAQLCVDHMQYSKSDYLGRIAGDEGK